jgi:AhpC/TSA family
MPEEKVKCVQPARGPITGSDEISPVQAEATQKEGLRMLARVGKPAPDFEATAYHLGGFTTIKLSDYVGKWIVLCFYPGDFTFV